MPVASSILVEPESIEVTYHGRFVGTLAQPRRGPVFFEYSDEWLRSGFSISPFSLPLQGGIFRADESMPDGIFGVFHDSLPDDWGRLVVDRKLRTKGLSLDSIGTLAQLSLVGSSGLGALEYHPDTVLPGGETPEDYDELSRECQQLIDSGKSDELDTLYRFGSSSGGARPKVMVDLDGDPWIVKFPTSIDGSDAGLLEYRYALAARDCGIEIPDIRLLPSKIGPGFFAIKRFDRVRQEDGSLEKIHMVSAAALLEASPFDVADYRDLMRLTLRMTNDARDAEQLYRVMCFNVFAGNCDDHLRNFSYLFDENVEAWHLSPAYDLTRNDGFMGEHSTLVNGEDSSITLGDLVAMGAIGGISARKCRAIARQVEEVCSALG